jgi:hypothetical protein
MTAKILTFGNTPPPTQPPSDQPPTPEEVRRMLERLNTGGFEAAMLITRHPPDQEFKLIWYNWSLGDTAFTACTMQDMFGLWMRESEEENGQGSA